MKIIKFDLNGITLFYKGEEKDEDKVFIKPIYQTIQGAIEGKSENAGVLMENKEVISLGKTIGWAKEETVVDKETVEDVIKKIKEAKKTKKEE
jgi:hypothetical protein